MGTLGVPFVRFSRRDHGGQSPRSPHEQPSESVEDQDIGQRKHGLRPNELDESSYHVFLLREHWGLNCPGGFFALIGAMTPMNNVINNSVGAGFLRILLHLTRSFTSELSPSTHEVEKVYSVLEDSETGDVLVAHRFQARLLADLALT